MTFAEIETKLRLLLEPKIIDKVLPPWRCCCGAIGNGEARAVALQMDCGDPTKSYAWTVEMVEVADPSKSYFIRSLRTFIDEAELNAIFASVCQSSE